MADKGIIFSAPMVRALIAGTKNQTRLLCAWANNPNSPALSYIVACDEPDWFGDEEGEVQFKAGYAPGDRLYVREAWKVTARLDLIKPSALKSDTPVYFTANDRLFPVARYRPGMHMPRWASRLWLAVTEVRVQRLQNISAADAVAEGIDDRATAHFGCPIKAYAALWDSLYGGESAHGWSANPWIVAVSFTVHRGNIDD